MRSFGYVFEAAWIPRESGIRYFDQGECETWKTCFGVKMALTEVDKELASALYTHLASSHILVTRVG